MGLELYLRSENVGPAKLYTVKGKKDNNSSSEPKGEMTTSWDEINSWESKVSKFSDLVGSSYTFPYQTTWFHSLPINTLTLSD